MSDESDIEAAKIVILDRMVELGWIERSLRTGTDVVFRPTERGHRILSEIHDFFTTEPPMNAAELIAFALLCKNHRPDE